MHEALRCDGQTVTLVPEFLREFCELHGRTPRRDEQRGIAQEQDASHRSCVTGHHIVIADTSALMTAVYSEHVFDDTSLYPEALRAQSGYVLICSPRSICRGSPTGCSGTVRTCRPPSIA